MNWYAYVGNDPINMADPTGKWLHAIAFGVGAVIGGISEAYSNPNADALSVGRAMLVGGIVGGALGKGVATGVKAAATKGLPNNSASQASHNMTNSTSQRVMADSQSLTNATGKAATAEAQVGAGFGAGAAVGTTTAEKICDKNGGC